VFEGGVFVDEVASQDGDGDEGFEFGGEGESLEADAEVLVGFVVEACVFVEVVEFGV